MFMRKNNVCMRICTSVFGLDILLWSHFNLSLSNGFTFFIPSGPVPERHVGCRLVSMCIPFYLSLFPWMERGQMGRKWPKTHKVDCLESVGKILDNGMRSINVVCYIQSYTYTCTNKHTHKWFYFLFPWIRKSDDVFCLLSQKFIT